MTDILSMKHAISISIASRVDNLTRNESVVPEERKTKKSLK